MTIEINDKVKINHEGETYDGEICTVVKTDKAGSFPYQVKMNDGENYWMTEDSVELVEKSNPATDRQISYLRDLGYTDTNLISKTEASAKIDDLKLIDSCHYCGQPANTFGFFDEPVCEECGG